MKKHAVCSKSCVWIFLMIKEMDLFSQDVVFPCFSLFVFRLFSSLLLSFHDLKANMRDMLLCTPKNLSQKYIFELNDIYINHSLDKWIWIDRLLWSVTLSFYYFFYCLFYLLSVWFKPGFSPFLVQIKAFFPPDFLWTFNINFFLLLNICRCIACL